ncbi:aminoglycoside phosphotransferase family protein [Chelatococcus reniformis]|uniref:3'-kinase n=1 Tax=Chelatococcus reniformis TaxID=1494448 RepID=A0A916TXU8_9HYPH|nr:aminoglycoside phosphotransferase family protein [Chelatococcus reniformis]GGC49663.1 3'-kinase [Chelatococcus reniformis]
MTGEDDDACAPYLARWGLRPDGASVATASSRLLPVTRDGEPAMLKVAVAAEERAGNALMTWWNGAGAAHVLAATGDALLLERATGAGSLARMARDGRDDEATAIICAVAAQVHAPRPAPWPRLVPLTQWFRALEPGARRHGGILPRCAAAAGDLLAAPREVCVLHGDIHHGNILDFGRRGWLAIDPKGLAGERAFDFANLFCNPDHAVATDPRRLRRRLDIVAAAARLDPYRLLQWLLAWAGLSAVWSMEDGLSPATALAVAELAAAELAC